MRIVVLEANALGNDIDLTKLQEFGEVIVYEETTKKQVVNRVEEADIVVINRVPMNEETLRNAANLKLICITGTGVNMVDFSYCKRHKIEVRNVPNYCTDSVAQHTIMLGLYLLEKFAFYEEHVNKGQYIKGIEQDYSEYRFHELAGKTWGICGLGNIGERVAQLAKAFSCNVIYYSTSGKNHNENYEEVDFKTLLKQSDILSVHAPLNDATRDLFQRNEFMQMKEESIFLNLGRGGIVKEEDLVWALKEKQIGAAGLDVLREEPMDHMSPLLHFKDKTRLVITPHIGWSSVEARERVLDAVCDHVYKLKV